MLTFATQNDITKERKCFMKYMRKIKQKSTEAEQKTLTFNRHFEALSNSLKTKEGYKLAEKKEAVTWINPKAKKGSKNSNFYAFDRRDWRKLNAYISNLIEKEEMLKAKGLSTDGVKSFNRNIWLDFSRESNAIEGILDDFSYDLLDFRAKVRGKIASDPSTANFERYEYFKKLYDQYNDVKAKNDSFIIDGKRKKHKISMDMAGQFIAFKYAYKCAKKDRFNQITKEDMMEMILNVNALLSGNECGRFRTEQRYVKAGGTGANWTPASPDKISEKMDALCDWATDEKQSGMLHPIEKAAIFHAEFERIHPFADGNGRTGRIMANYILMKNEIPTVSIRYKNTPQYLKAMNKAIETHDAQDVIALFARGVEDSAIKISKCLKFIETEKKTEKTK